MRIKNSYFYTIREDIKDEETISGKLLTKAGMIKKNANGIYSYLPLGYKVLKNIINIINEEMEDLSCAACLMPILNNNDEHLDLKNKDSFDSFKYNVIGRDEKKYSLSFSSEHEFISCAKSKIKSYKDLPFSMYQIQNKYRDEAKIRYGLIKEKEFIIKEAFSFTKDERDSDNFYNSFLNSYKKIFSRLGLDYKVVLSGSGNSDVKKEEFHALTNVSDDKIVICKSCGYSANILVSSCYNKDNILDEDIKIRELVKTKDVKSLDELSLFLNVPKNKIVKTIIYKSGDCYYAALVNGLCEVSEYKLKKALGLNTIMLATKEEIEDVIKVKPGFVGPISLDMKIVVDNEVLNMKNFVVGANKDDYHYINVNLEDFNYFIKDDIRLIKEDDLCPCCKNNIEFKNSIEIGNIMKVSKDYSRKQNLFYLDSNNKEQVVCIGSYCIGISRLLAAIAEQNSFDDKLIWPYEVSPFKVAIIIINHDDEKQLDGANYLYNEFKKAGISTILDDRDERAGVKFNDMELIGIPIILTIGNKIADSLVEIKQRKNDNIYEISMYDALNKIEDIIDGD